MPASPSAFGLAISFAAVFGCACDGRKALRRQANATREVREARVGAQCGIQRLRVELKQGTAPPLVRSFQTSERFILVSETTVSNCQRPQRRHVFAIRPMQQFG